MEILNMLKSKDKFERVEGYCIVFLIAGSLIMSSGIGLTIVTPKGVPAIMAMLGALIAFLATVGLIFTWLFQEIFGE
jgi:predicted membrane channel-forming protein YqfA (hemolysin III family)